ncbi:MAG: transcription antitermination factor NusB [Geminicoccaceae bacterium]
MSRRRAARFAAVQALYQVELTGRSGVEIIAEFERHRLGDLFEADGSGKQPLPVDRDHFQRTVAGASASRDKLDDAIRASLAEDWSLERVGFTLRAILRAGGYELHAFTTIDVDVVISEYVELSREFFQGREPAFVHAVLDRMAKRLRRPPDDLSALAEPGNGLG